MSYRITDEDQQQLRAMRNRNNNNHHIDQDTTADCDGEQETMDIESEQYTPGQKKVRYHMVNVILEEGDKNESFLIPNVAVHLTDHHISIQELIDKLCRDQWGNSLMDCVIYLWDEQRQLFIFVGENDIKLDTRTLSSKQQVTLRYKSRHQQKIIRGSNANTSNFCKEESKQDEAIKEENREQFIQQLINEQKGHQNKRVKERTISFALSIVQQWREVYEKPITYFNRNEKIKLNLNQAAQMVGLSRKTLDDYHLQIKRGREFGFDFDAHLEDKIGVLRKFNRECVEPASMTDGNALRNDYRYEDCEDLEDYEEENNNNNNNNRTNTPTDEMVKFDYYECVDEYLCNNNTYQFAADGEGGAKVDGYCDFINTSLDFQETPNNHLYPEFNQDYFFQRVGSDQALSRRQSNEYKGLSRRQSNESVEKKNKLSNEGFEFEYYEFDNNQ